MACEAMQWGSGHPDIAEHLGMLAEANVGGNDHAGAFVSLLSR